MPRQIPYLHLPGIPFPVFPQLKFLKEGSGIPYFGIKDVISIYRILKDANYKGKGDSIVKSQPSVQTKQKEFDGEREKYKIKEYPKDLENADESVRIYIKNLERLCEEEKNFVMRTLTDFSRDLFERNYSVLVGVLQYLPENGKNAVFYETPEISKDGQVNFSNAKSTSVNWPVTYGKPTEDIMQLLGDSKDYYIFADRERVVRENGGLALVCCRFGVGAIDSILPISTKEKVGIITGVSILE